MSDSVLLQLQLLLGRINAVGVTHPVTEFLLQDANVCAELLGRSLADDEDEQVLLSESDGSLSLTVYVNAQVVSWLARHNPLQRLATSNLAAFCSAVEGISHFHYLIWCAQQGRSVSLLELELQAEVDKYSLASCLLQEQGCTSFQAVLHSQMFAHVGYIRGLEMEQRQRYVEANRCAARFCQRADERFLRGRRPRRDLWFAELRQLFRCGHHEKLRRAAYC